MDDLLGQGRGQAVWLDGPRLRHYGQVRVKPGSPPPRTVEAIRPGEGKPRSWALVITIQQIARLQNTGLQTTGLRMTKTTKTKSILTASPQSGGPTRGPADDGKRLDL